MNKKGKIIGLSLVAIMVVSLFAVAIPSVAAQNGDNPDLVITNIQVVGNRIQYTIENIGTADAPTSYTGLYIDGIYRARDCVDPLAPGEESDEEFERYNYRGGEIEVCADYQDRIEEENEENNCRGGLPDLVIIEKYETVDALSCEFMVHFTVCNVGESDAGASVACVHINGNDFVEGVVGGGPGPGEVPVPPLGIGECSEELTSGPYECIPCTILIIEVEADNYNDVDECDEENNILENEFHCPAPDLEITEKFETVDPVDCTFTVTYTVHNDGNCIAGESETTIWIDGESLLEDPVPALEPCQTYTNVVGPFEFECIPCTILTIGVEADNNHVVAECNEENNILENEFHCPAPDLEITYKEEIVNPADCTFMVTYTVHNDGNCIAGESTTVIYIKGGLGLVDPVPALGPCESYTNVVGPYECTPCEILTIVVEADWWFAVAECNEENNILENEFHCPAPDLIITNKHETLDVDTCTFRVTYTVMNVGNCKAGASTTTTTVGVVTDNFATPALDPGAEIEHTTATGFDCVPGGVEVTVTADSADTVEECTEDNNEVTNTYYCCPDLIITEKEETVDADTCTFTVTYTVKNIGNCTAGASTTRTTVDGGCLVDVYATPALAPGETHTYTTVTAFDCDPDGSVITVTADSAGVVVECDETNNDLENEFLCCPDLIITEKEETVDVEACTFTVTYTVKNIGNCTAGASTTRTTVGLVDDDFVTPELDPEEEVEHTTATAFDCDPDGSVITVTADNEDAVDECDEDNNDLVNEFLCCPDLIITEKEEVVDVDTCTFTVTYTVNNIGNCKAGASTTTTTVDGVDDEFATPELDPEEEIEHTTVTAFDCVPGGVEVTVTADSVGVVDECDEGNNEMTNIAICLCEPDLVITDIWVVGNRIHYTIKNIGGEPAPRSYTGLWINDNYRARDHVDPLAPEEESEEEFERENYKGGEIRVCADYQDRIEEANEENNCREEGNNG